MTPDQVRIEQLENRLLDAKAKSDPMVWVEVDLIEKLLQHEAERNQVQFSFDWQRQTVRIAGQLFALALLEHFQTSSGEDECYQHVRREDGVVVVTRTLGHRGTMGLLRHMLDRRPRAVTHEQMMQWNADVELVLEMVPDVVAREAGYVNDLVKRVSAFRASTQPPADENDTEWRTEQMRAAAEMFAVHEQLLDLRSRLFSEETVPEVPVEGTES